MRSIRIKKKRIRVAFTMSASRERARAVIDRPTRECLPSSRLSYCVRVRSCESVHLKSRKFWLIWPDDVVVGGSGHHTYIIHVRLSRRSGDKFQGGTVIFLLKIQLILFMRFFFFRTIRRNNPRTTISDDIDRPPSCRWREIVGTRTKIILVLFFLLIFINMKSWGGVRLTIGPLNLPATPEIFVCIRVFVFLTTDHCAQKTILSVHFAG